VRYDADVANKKSYDLIRADEVCVGMEICWRSDARNPASVSSVKPLETGDLVITASGDARRLRADDLVIRVRLVAA